MIITIDEEETLFAIKEYIKNKLNLLDDRWEFKVYRVDKFDNEYTIELTEKETGIPLGPIPRGSGTTTV